MTCWPSRGAQDDIGAYISSGMSFSLKALSDSFERGMELLAENILHPALPETAFTVVRDETLWLTSGPITEFCLSFATRSSRGTLS